MSQHWTASLIGDRNGSGQHVIIEDGISLAYENGSIELRAEDALSILRQLQKLKPELLRLKTNDDLRFDSS